MRSRENPIRKTTGKGGNYRPTKSGAGMTSKGVAAYRRANPGSKLKTAVTGKVKKGLYYYMNRAKKRGTSRPGKGTVTDKALKRSAKTAKKS